MYNLPTDIVILILQFDGRIKYRRGQYIDCIHKNDGRYNLLSQLHLPTPVKYTMEYDCSHPEHFEYCINFNELYELRVWNIYHPPNKIKYVFYNMIDLSRFYTWFRK
jgi:hypothetical protein